MNLLSKSDVFAENKLFATLDTTTRKLVYENMPFLMSDTVGFIRKLPHHLVESFKSTLDEVRESDLLLHVVDISHPRYEEQLGVVNKTLQEINAFDKPVIYVFNKMDRYEELNFDEWLEEGTKEELLKELKERWEAETQSVCIFMSATERSNVDGLREALLSKVKELYKERFPYRTEYFY
jgi:GTP-binding protein HflX